MSDTDILKDLNEAYDQGISCWGSYLAEAYKDIKFYVGNQWSDADKTYLEQEGRSAYVFNNIRRVIKMISGHQRKNRLSSTCEPIEGSDEGTAELFTDLLLWVMQYQGGYNLVSDAFESAAITGISLLSLWPDYSDDLVNGDIKISYDTFNSFILDPYFTKQDLSDCRYIIRRRFVTPDTAKSLLPGRAREIDELPRGEFDNKFDYMVASRKNMAENLISYDEYWRRVVKPRKLLIDKLSGETRLWNGTKAGLTEFKSQYPWIDTKTVYKPTVELNIVLQGVVFDTVYDGYGLNDYPFVPILGFYEPTFDEYDYRLQGVVRCMRDPQEELNKRRSKMADILDSQANSGWITKEGTVNNKRDLYRTGQGVVIETSLSSMPGDLQKIPSPEIPQSLFALIAELNKDILQIPGINEELMGTADAGNSEISGTLAKVRSANGLTTLQDLFDKLALSQKMLGSKIITMIQKNWTADKVKRITNKEVTPEFYNSEFGKYDCVVKESMLTDTQKHMAYVQALQARQVGIPIPDSFIIDMLPIGNKEELKQAYEQEAEAEKLQKEKMDAQEEMQLKLQNSKIVSDLSLADERRSRGAANIGLLRARTAESFENLSQAQLNQAKTASEIQSTDQTRFLEALNVVMAMGQQLQDRAAQEVEDTKKSEFKETVATAQLVTPPNQNQDQGA